MEVATRQHERKHVSFGWRRVRGRALFLSSDRLGPAFESRRIRAGSRIGERSGADRQYSAAGDGWNASAYGFGGGIRGGRRGSWVHVAALRIFSRRGPLVAGGSRGRRDGFQPRTV